MQPEVPDLMGRDDDPLMRVEVRGQADESVLPVQGAEDPDGIPGAGREPADLELGDLQGRLDEGFGGRVRGAGGGLGMALARLQAPRKARREGSSRVVGAR